jgi:FKBP-type peptidyl-prolyl cis-trans isomerase
MVLLGIEKSITEDPTNPYMPSAVIDSLTRQLESHAMEKQQQKMMEQQNKFEERSKTAAEDGKKFFAENKNKPGVVSDKAGFQYRIITKGEGALPTEEQMIKFHFIAKFIDGEEIQSTYKSTPIEMPLMYGSPVMIELIKKMPVGSKWEIF